MQLNTHFGIQRIGSIDNMNKRSKIFPRICLTMFIRLKQNFSNNRDKRQEFLLDRSQIPPFLLRIEQGRACPFLDHALQLSLE